MAPILIFEDSQLDRLYPLTYSRAAFELRCGAFTLLERMLKAIGRPVAGVLVRDTLSDIIRRRISVPVNPAVSTREGLIFVNARWLMTEPWAEPDAGTVGLRQAAIAWMHLAPQDAAKVDLSQVLEPKTLETFLPDLLRKSAAVTLIDRPWDLITHQHATLLEDWKQFGQAKEGLVLTGAHLLAPENIYLGKNTKINPGVVLDAQNGPIMIDEGSEIRPNAVVTGPVYVGRDCQVRVGADIREDNAFGPNTRVGGEVLGSIFLGNANKQHYGYLGQSVVGEWANLGAGTTTSNLKNTYGTVRVPINGVEESSGRQFLGSVIADHAKLGIGTYLSTGSVVGFGSQVATSRPPKFVPSFAWVTDKGIERANFEKIEAIAKTAMSRRGLDFTPALHEMFVRVATEWSLREKFDWPQ